MPQAENRKIRIFIRDLSASKFQSLFLDRKIGDILCLLHNLYTKFD